MFTARVLNTHKSDYQEPPLPPAQSRARLPYTLRPSSVRPLASWEDEVLFDQAAPFFEQLIDSINQARLSVWLEFYIFSYDNLGKRVIQALHRAVERGVEVRVLIDGIGSSETSDQSLKAMSDAGIAVKIFHPLPWQLNKHRWSLSPGSSLGKLFYLIRAINQRDHRKLCIVDHQTLWTGSFNISQKHLNEEAGGENWRDYGLRVTGTGVAEIAENYAALWQYQRPKLRHGLFKYYWNNLNALARRRKNRLLVEHIRSAQQRIWITSAYFSPSPRVLKALKQAGRRNLDIRLLVPKKSDVRFFPLLTASYYSDLLRSGIRVYEYGPRFLHAKALLLDAFCLVGSTNFNHRSFLHDLELDIVLHTDGSKQQLEACFLHDLNQATEVRLEDIGFRRRLAWLGWIPRLLRYWM